MYVHKVRLESLRGAAEYQGWPSSWGHSAQRVGWTRRPGRRGAPAGWGCEEPRPAPASSRSYCLAERHTHTQWQVSHAVSDCKHTAFKSRAMWNDECATVASKVGDSERSGELQLQVGALQPCQHVLVDHPGTLSKALLHGVIWNTGQVASRQRSQPEIWWWWCHFPQLWCLFCHFHWATAAMLFLNRQQPCMLILIVCEGFSCLF